jgi:hypothetical protein
LFVFTILYIIIIFCNSLDRSDSNEDSQDTQKDAERDIGSVFSHSIEEDDIGDEKEKCIFDGKWIGSDFDIEEDVKEWEPV